MDDRTLLKLAAKAAGYDIRSDAWACGPSGAVPRLYMGNNGPEWNPLTDDGDALRLAVNLRIDINHMAMEVFAIEQLRSIVTVEPNDDPYAATRRAIVRAAASIGKEGK